jgi:hypothetical protein
VGFQWSFDAESSGATGRVSMLNRTKVKVQADRNILISHAAGVEEGCI